MAEVNLPHRSQVTIFILRSKKQILGYSRSQKVLPDDTTTCPVPEQLLTCELLGICSLEDEPAAVLLGVGLLRGWPHSNKF